MAGMYCMNDLLELVLREGAEELHLQIDKPPVMAVQGKPLAIDVPAVTADNVAELLQSIATEKQLGELRACGNIHFIYVFQNSARFSVTAAMQHEAITVKIRNLGR